MASYFTLELDTTPPNLEVYAPQYTKKDIFTEIRIVSNERLMQYQDVYVVDSEGNRFDLTFNYDGNAELVASVRFNQLSTGIATLYCRLKDVVANVSDLYSKPINIAQGNKLKLNINDMTRMPSVYDKYRTLEYSVHKRRVDTYINGGDVVG